MKQWISDYKLCFQKIKTQRGGIKVSGRNPKAIWQ